jgi:hypothetical protein
VYWIDLTPRPGMTTVPLADLFAEGVGSRITVQPCPAASPPQATAATTPANAPAPAGSGAPAAGTAPPQPPAATAPAPTHIAASPKASAAIRR